MSLTNIPGKQREKEAGSIGLTAGNQWARRTFTDNFADLINLLLANPIPVDSGSIISGIAFDAINVNYPNSTTETYLYYQGGIGGTLVATVTVIYSTASKKDIVSVVRT